MVYVLNIVCINYLEILLCAFNFSLKITNSDEKTTTNIYNKNVFGSLISEKRDIRKGSILKIALTYSCIN